VPLGLLTDLYELTMAAGYVAAGKDREKATFELFVRRLPPGRNYLVAAGLRQAVEYLLRLTYSEEEIAYLQALVAFQNAPAGFWEALRNFRFTGDVFAVPEGTPVFAGEPLLTVRAPIVEAQIPETYLLATVGFQTMVASKAARVVQAARGKAVVEFGTRRAHSPEAGVLAARAAYIGGCIGTSNTEAGFRYGIPVYGTAAHSWVQSFATETEAFEQLQNLLGSSTVYLVDTYDAVEGTRHAARLGSPLWGIRLDSGDLEEQSRAARRILNEAGLTEAKIMASGDLNEARIRRLEQAGAPIDAYGVGTELSTSADAPALSVVYKLAEIQRNGERRFGVKLSSEKETVPGVKQVFRHCDHDVIGLVWECPGCGSDQSPEPLLRPVILRGEPVEEWPELRVVREKAKAAVSRLPEACQSLEAGSEPYRVEWSEELRGLEAQVRAGLRKAES